jgi:hypothetical protein
MLHVADATILNRLAARADDLYLAARASRTPEDHATLLSIAGQIVRGRRAEIVLNGVGHALAVLPDLAGALGSVFVGSCPSPFGILARCRRPGLDACLRARRRTRGHNQLTRDPTAATATARCPWPICSPSGGHGARTTATRPGRCRPSAATSVPSSRAPAGKAAGR